MLLTAATGWLPVQLDVDGSDGCKAMTWCQLSRVKLTHIGGLLKCWSEKLKVSQTKKTSIFELLLCTSTHYLGRNFDPANAWRAICPQVSRRIRFFGEELWDPTQRDQLVNTAVQLALLYPTAMTMAKRYHLQLSARINHDPEPWLSIHRNH